MLFCRALQSPLPIVTQKLIRNAISETEPAFGFHTRPVDGAPAAWRGQHNLPAKQRNYMPGRDRADNEGGIVRRDTARLVVISREICGKGVGGCSWRVNSRVVRVGNGFRVELVGAHSDVFGRRRAVLILKLKAG